MCGRVWENGDSEAVKIRNTCLRGVADRENELFDLCGEQFYTFLSTFRQDAACIFYALCRGRRYTLEGVGNVALFPFEKSQRMIGQHIDALDVLERAQEVAKLREVIVVVGNTRHKDMTHPDGFSNLGEIARTIQDVLIGMVREFLMLQRIDMLDVEQEQVRVVHQLLEFAEKRLASGERLSAGVDTGVYAALLRLLEKLRQEVDLEQRFSTAHGDAAIFSPIGAIAFGFGEELFGRHLLPLPSFPRVGILTIAAAHATTLKENDETDAWSVN